LKANPDWRERLRGDLQMHTTWSDGSGSVAQMAAAEKNAATNTLPSQITQRIEDLPVALMKKPRSTKPRDRRSESIHGET